MERAMKNCVDQRTNSYPNCSREKWVYNNPQLS